MPAAACKRLAAGPCDDLLSHSDRRSDFHCFVLRTGGLQRTRGEARGRKRWRRGDSEARTARACGGCLLRPGAPRSAFRPSPSSHLARCPLLSTCSLPVSKRARATASPRHPPSPSALSCRSSSSDAASRRVRARASSPLPRTDLNSSLAPAARTAHCSVIPALMSANAKALKALGEDAWKNRADKVVRRLCAS